MVLSSSVHPVPKSVYVNTPIDVIPKHVAIIMDGNRRWARLKGLPSIVGHWEGANVLPGIVRAAIQVGVKVLTVYAFSTENWLRPQEEIEGLIDIFLSFLEIQTPFMLQEGVRLNYIGDISKFPQNLIDRLNQTIEKSSCGDHLDLVLALNYGGRDDIRRAVCHLVDDCLKGNLKKEDISEQVLTNYLDTAKWCDPDLCIRTSGELRLSNFLLWQMSYAEVYSTPVLWPDFSDEDFYEAIRVYSKRQRRFGDGS